MIVKNYSLFIQVKIIFSVRPVFLWFAFTSLILQRKQDEHSHYRIESLELVVFINSKDAELVWDWQTLAKVYFSCLSVSSSSSSSVKWVKFSALSVWRRNYLKRRTISYLFNCYSTFEMINRNLRASGLTQNVTNPKC